MTSNNGIDLIKDFLKGTDKIGITTVDFVEYIA